MYHHLRGKVVDLGPTSVVIEVSGVGYDLRIPLSTFERLKGAAEADVYTHLHVREDELRLFGFGTPEERELFRLLLSVSGVGPGIALSALCALSPTELAQALAASDHKLLQRVKGVGRKLAERLSLELRERAQKLLPVLGVVGTPDRRPQSSAEDPIRRSRDAQDAIAALVSLGFEKKSAEERVDATSARLSAGARTVPIETFIKECLRGG